MTDTVTLPRPLIAVLKAFLTLAVPVLLVIFSIRLVMSPLYLQFEYNRPGFPEDPFGFTKEDRLRYAPFAIDYLLNGEEVSYLGDLRFPDGRALYNANELRHMRDVKVVTQLAYLAGVIVGILAALAAFGLWRKGVTRHELFAALRSGSILTFSLIAAIVVLAVVSWDVFFTGFHTLFFESGTWRFAYSDTLIRLFPEQFWFDAALLIGGVTILGAGLLLVISWRFARS